MALQDGGGSSCFDENTVLDFVQGRLTETDVARIDEHVDSCLSCRNAIDEAVRAFRERVTGFDLPPAPRVTRFVAGDNLAGRYRIVRFIARGGMGEVYEAEDQMLGTHIAVKTIAATISDNPLAARRLKQEVNLARRITHPNVCRIFDLGVHHSGADRFNPDVLFITMELIAGVSLAQRLRDQGRFAPRAALPIVRAMAAAIGAAHRAGVVHRDFKSENVMLASGGEHRDEGDDSDGDGMRVVVMDFGLARATSLSTQDSLEGRGLAGTLAYMAPEQLDGQRAGQPADIYALGVVMFEMLTGRLPFLPAPGDVPLSAVLNRLSEAAPALRSVLPDIDARWNDVVARCLEREVERRLASADEIVRALGNEVSIDIPVPAPASAARVEIAAPRAAPSGARPHRWRRAGLVAAGVGGLVAVTVALQHRAAPPDRAALPAATSVAPSLPTSPAPPPAVPPEAAAAAPKGATTAVPERAADDHPASTAGDRRPAARRPSAPPAPRRDRAAGAAAPKRGDDARAAASSAVDEDSPKQIKERRRSADPADGFIFQ